MGKILTFGGMGIIALALIAVGIAGVVHIISLERNGVWTTGWATSFIGMSRVTFSDIENSAHSYTFVAWFPRGYGEVSVVYDPSNPNNAIAPGIGAWIYPLGDIVVGGLTIWFLLYLLKKAPRKATVIDKTPVKLLLPWVLLFTLLLAFLLYGVYSLTWMFGALILGIVVFDAGLVILIF